MKTRIASAARRVSRPLNRLLRDKRGNVALLFGLCAMMIFSAMGAGLDLSRAYLARQKLSQTATLACQYASRPSIVDTSAASYNGSNGGSIYVNNVKTYIATTWQSQNDSLKLSTATFSYVQGGTSSVNLASSVPTTFMSIAGFDAIPITVLTQCYPALSTCPQSQCGKTSSPFLFPPQSFEPTTTSPGTWTTYLPNGSKGYQSTSSGYTSATGYTGEGGTQWHISGYCLEQDGAGVIKSSIYDGNFSIELDCGNTNYNTGGSQEGISAISTMVYMPAGFYELRYAYTSRVVYPDYDPTYICGSTASDVSWANSTNTASGTALRTNQVNVYLDLNPTNSTSGPPTHTTIDGTQQLAGSNLIDICLYGPNWIERSVSLNITTPGYYWLSFAADGASDSQGGQIDNIRLCSVTCPGSVQDNFPKAWASSTKPLFEDSFESPVYSPDYSDWIAKSGNLNLSYGTTATSQVAASGWPKQSQTGWATWPLNQINYILKGAAQGNQYISMDGYNTGTTSRNRLISRPFLLVPGYYQVSYNYISNVDFGAVGTYCASMPNSGYVFTSNFPTGTGNIRFMTPPQLSTDGSTNIVGVFMSHGQSVSTPITGGAFGSATSYNNPPPNATVTTTATVPPDAVTWSSYNAAALNPVLDACQYVPSYAWSLRTANVKISKTGYYWLTFSANGGTPDGNGGGIDDVKLTALGGLSYRPPSFVTIPVPDPQPDSPWSGPSGQTFNGFTITADPFFP